MLFQKKIGIPKFKFSNPEIIPLKYKKMKIYQSIDIFNIYPNSAQNAKIIRNGKSRDPES